MICEIDVFINNQTTSETDDKHDQPKPRSASGTNESREPRRAFR